MPSAEHRALHMYRKPVYQKRFMVAENYKSNPYTRSPSPKRSVLVSRRRHSTPPASTLRTLEGVSSPSNKVVKHYYPPTRASRISRESSSISDSIKSTPSSIPLLQRRFYDERISYISTTPSSIASITDIILPTAKKNLTTIVDIPSHIKPDIHSIDRESSTNKQWKKRGAAKSFDLGRHVFISDEDTLEYSTTDYIHKPKPVQSSKRHQRKCPCRRSYCNFCCKWYYRCPLFCWSLCFLSIILLFIGILVSVGYLSS